MKKIRFYEFQWQKLHRTSVDESTGLLDWKGTAFTCLGTD